MNSLQEAIFEAMGRQSPDNSQVDSQAGLPEAQRAELQRVCQAVERATGQSLVRGQFVRYIERTGQLHREVEPNAQLMFWSWLDWGNPWHRQVAKEAANAEVNTLANVDCLLMHVLSSSVAFLLSSSELLIPDSPAASQQPSSVGKREAILVKELDGPKPGHNRKIWRITNPEEFVVTSAVFNQHVHETYIFACDSEGRVSDWTELPGSFQGGTDHQRAINGFLAEANSQAGSHE